MATEFAWLDQHGAAPVRRTQQAMGWMVGLLLPLYLLDESVALKAMLSPLIGLSCVGLLIVSRSKLSAGNGMWRLLAVCFTMAYTSSLFVSILGAGVGVNAFYPLLFIALCFRAPFVLNGFLRGLFLGLLALVLFGWSRFITGEGGLPAEHMLGYWGIKYTAATRNGDALAPLMLTGITLAFIRPLSSGASSWFVRWILWISLTIALPALALTFARSAWIAAVCFLLLNSGFDWRRLMKSASAVCIAIFALYTVARFVAPDLIDKTIDPVALIERIQSIYNTNISSSNNERARLLSYAINLGINHPLFGVGSGGFECCIRELGYFDLMGSRHPENLFLHLFTEYGFLAAFFSFACLVVAGGHGLRSALPAARFAAATLISFVVWLQFNSELSSFFVWVVMGIACSVALRRPR